MRKTLIIGASGQIGKQLTQSLLNNQQEVVALVRDKSKLAELNSEYLTIVEADLKEDFSQAFEQCATVVFVAGSGGSTGADQTLLIDLWAASRAADYAKAHDLAHFVMVSSIGADAPDKGPQDMQPYLVAKHMADDHLIKSGVFYSIIRPGTLTNNEATGVFTSERPSNKEQATIARADVANALMFCVNNPPKESVIVELFNGDKNIDQVL